MEWNRRDELRLFSRIDRIGKPEGLFVWHVNGVVECIFPCFDAVDT
jgi:hypothetical protein